MKSERSDVSGLSNLGFQSDDKAEPATLQIPDGSLHLRNLEDRKHKDDQIHDRNENIDVELKSVILQDCALACLKLKFLNKFRSPKWFLVFLSMAACLQGKEIYA